LAATAAAHALAPFLDAAVTGDTSPRVREPDDEQRVGFFAFLDALGFERLCKAKDALPEIVRKLRSVTERVELERTPYYPGHGPNYDVAYFSDTVIVTSTVTIAGEDVQEASGALMKLTDGLARLWEWMLVDSPGPPIALRGAIGWGDHVVSHPFIVGPAIVDAHQHERRPEAAVIVLSPNARKVLDLIVAARPDEVKAMSLRQATVPMKSWRQCAVDANSSVTVTTISDETHWIVRPSLDATDVREPLSRAFRLDGECANDLSVRRKYRATMRFFETTKPPDD